MRVTNAATYRKFTTAANDVHARLNKSFAKVSSGEAYESAAESPLNYYKSKKIDNQYLDTLSKKSLLKNVQNRIYQQELGARDIQDILSKAKNQVQYARTSTTTSTALKSIRDDLLQKQHEIVNDLNAQYQDYYIYGGNDISTAPFSLSADGTEFTFTHIFPGEEDPTTFVFKLTEDTAKNDGSYKFELDLTGSNLTPTEAEKKLRQAMSEQGRIDIGYGSIRDKNTLLDTYTGGLNVLTGVPSDGISTNPNDPIGGEKTVADLLSKSPIGLIGQAVQTISKYSTSKESYESGAAGAPTAEEMEKITGDTYHILGETISSMTEAEHTVSTVYADLGNRYRLLTDMETKLNKTADSLTEQYTNAWGADPYESIVELYNNQYAYNAALQVGSNLMGSSLFDFMR
ncbi:MAG: flagellar hook-basal body protein [Lachnospiraceae bacterium]|nr:flagellar hook-basal body protein [Lachnospiraceae bacterium]